MRRIDAFRQAIEKADRNNEYAVLRALDAFANYR